MMVSFRSHSDQARRANQKKASLPADFMVWAASEEAQFLRGKYVFANWDVNEMKEQAERIRNTGALTMTLQGWPFADQLDT